MNRPTRLLRCSTLLVTLLFLLSTLGNAWPWNDLPRKAKRQDSSKRVLWRTFTPPTTWRSENLSISSSGQNFRAESSLGLSISPRDSTLAGDIQSFLLERNLTFSPDAVKISSDRGELIGRVIEDSDQLSESTGDAGKKSIRFILYGNVDGNDYAYIYEFAYQKATLQILSGTATSLNGDGYEVNYETGEAFKLSSSSSDIRISTTQADIDCILNNLLDCSTFVDLVRCIVTLGTSCLDQFLRAILINLACGITATCSPLPSFTLSAAPSSRSIKQGQSTTYTVQVTFTNGFKGPVSSFSVSNLNSGASPSFTPSSVSSSGGSTTLNISTSGKTQTGSRTLTISAIGGGRTKSATTSLFVDVGRGTIQVNATLNGATWRGGLTYGITGTSIGGGTSVPKTHTDMPAGSYGLTFLFGGPSNAVLASITPLNLTLSPGATATFTLNFISAPAAPSNLQATTVSSSQISLRWNDNSNNESEFRIERKRTASGFWSEIQRIGANVTSFSDSGLSSNTTYYYRVRASNSAGQSAYSNEANTATRR